VHLLLAPPETDPHVVDVLRDAAAAAGARGDAGTARRFLQRALNPPHRVDEVLDFLTLTVPTFATAIRDAL
jgi:hypothetical protein